MTTQTVDKEALYQKILSLSDSIEDPFYNESNMKHLLSVKSDVQAGLNMSAHDLVELDDD